MSVLDAPHAGPRVLAEYANEISFTTTALFASSADVTALGAVIDHPGGRLRIDVGAGNGSNNTALSGGLVRVFYAPYTLGGTVGTLREIYRRQITSPTASSGANVGGYRGKVLPPGKYLLKMTVSAVTSGSFNVQAAASPSDVQPIQFSVAADESRGRHGHRLTYGQSRVTSGDFDFFAAPVDFKADGTKLPIVFLHGNGGSVAQTLHGGSGWLDWTGEFVRLVAERYPVIGTDLGGVATWGAAATNTRIEENRTAAGTVFGCDNSKVILWGISMGALSAIEYLRAHPDRVAGIVVMEPVSNLTYLYTGNGSNLGYKDLIAAAHGVTHPTALPPTAGPSSNLQVDPYGAADVTALHGAVPVYAFHSTADLVNHDQVNATDYVTPLWDVQLGGTVYTVSTSLGHGSAEIHAMWDYGDGGGDTVMDAFDAIVAAA